MEESLRQILFHLAEVERLTRTKTYRNALSEIDQQIMIALDVLERVEYITGRILSGRKILKKESSKSTRQLRARLWEMAVKAADKNPSLAKGKSGRKRKKGEKAEKGMSLQITCALVKEGHSIEEVALKRSLAVSTIEGHVISGIGNRKLEISDVLPGATVKEVGCILKESQNTIGEIHQSLNGKYSYGVLRMVKTHLEIHENLK